MAPRRRSKVLFDNNSMVTCAFKGCGNRARDKPGLVFYSFDDVPPLIREKWLKIVARERCVPRYKPRSSFVKICAEHFASHDINPSQVLCSSALPTINIGSYDDNVIIANEETNSDDVICIIENQIATQCTHQDDDIVCVIENQISTEPKAPTTDEKDVDIEDQIQWSLVGTSKHFEGLIHTIAPESPQIAPPVPLQPTTAEKESDEDDDVVIVEEETIHDIIETESDNEGENVFENQFSRFLKTYDKIKLLNFKPRKVKAKRKKLNQDKSDQILRQALTVPKQLEVTKTQPTTAVSKQLTNTKQQVMHTVPKQFVATTQQLIPIQIEQNSQFTPPQLAVTPHTATPVFATASQTLTPLMVYQVATPADARTQLVTLVPSNASVSGMKLSTVFLENNNIKTYFLSNILPSAAKLVNKSDPNKITFINQFRSEGIGTQQCLTLNDCTPEANFVIKSDEDSEQFLPVIVKTEKNCDF